MDFSCPPKEIMYSSPLENFTLVTYPACPEYFPLEAKGSGHGYLNSLILEKSSPATITF